MAKIKVTSEWWTAPTESENGNLIIVTGRAEMDAFRTSGKYNDRIEVTWKYDADEKGMPDFKTSSLMETVTDKLNEVFDADPVAIMTGIYTGDGERTIVFYCRSLNIFGKKFNEALAEFELLPLTLYAEKDPEWNEYLEMKDSSEIEIADL